MSCPDDNTLQLVLADEMTGFDGRAAVLRHIDDCSQCQAKLEKLIDDQELRSWRDSPEFKNSRFLEAERTCRKWIGNFVYQAVRAGDTAKSLTTQHERPAFAKSPVAGDLGMLDRYRIVREIGRGGMSLVFEAIDSRLGRSVAVKVLHASLLDDESRQRFLREAKAVASIRHPHVITIFGAESSEDAHPYLVMELIHGESLGEQIRRTQGLPARLAAEIVAQVADGLDAAHKAGLVHRDIKPSNILLSHAAGSVAANGDSTTANDGREPVVAKLVDFGLARPVELSAQITRTGILAGTPAYISPEQISSPDTCDARSDIYSLGVTLYEALTGMIPFRGAPHAVLRQIEQDEPLPPSRLNPQIPRDLETICLKAITRDPRGRYPTAREFSADLRRWQRGEPIHARPVSSVERLVRWSRRNPRVAGLVATVASLLVILAAGSTAAALHIRSSNQRLSNEKSAALAAEQRARESAESAMRQRTLALDSLDALVSKVQQQLGTRPGTLKLRADILRSALDGLEQVVKSTEFDRVDHTTISAHLRMGEILALLGRTDESQQHYQAAQHLADQALIDSPDDSAFLRDLADALAHEGDVHHRGFAWDKSTPIFTRVLEIRRKLTDLSPDDPAAWHGLVVCEQRLIDPIHYGAGKTDEAIQRYEQLLGMVEDLTRRFVGDPVLRRDFLVIHNRLGTLYESRQEFDPAYGHFMTSYELTTAQLDDDPDDPAAQLDMANVVGRIAMLAGKQRDFAVAIPMAERAARWYQHTAESNPDDTEAQVKLATWCHATYEIRLAQRNFDLAQKSLAQSLQIYERLSTLHPATCRFPTLAAEIAYKLGDLDLRMGRVPDALLHYKQAREFLTRCHAAVDFSPQTIAVIEAAVDCFVPAMELLNEGPAAIAAALEARPGEASFAKAAHMYQLALHGDVAESLRVGNELQMIKELSPPLVFNLVQFQSARAAALCASQSTAMGSAELHRRSIGLCADITRSLVARSPEFRSWFAQEPDFDAVISEIATH